MKPKSLSRIISLIFFLIPITVFSSEWTQVFETTEPMILSSIWGSSAADIFAVGDVGYLHPALIFHYDGTTWSPMDSGTTTSWALRDIWGSSETDVFTVGSSGIILHYDGSQWTPMDSGVQTQNVDLLGIWGSSSRDIYSVGALNIYLEIHFSVFTIPILPVARHYNGKRWSHIKNWIKGFYVLTGIWGSSKNDIFTVGYTLVYGNKDIVILHYDGEQWSSMEHPTIIAGYYGYGGIWGASGSDVFTVGASGAILHYDGERWTQMDSGTTTDLSAIWGSSPTNVFAVGGEEILRYDGMKWSLMTRLGTGTSLSRVWGSSETDIYAVGFDFIHQQGIILHYDGMDGGGKE